MRERGRVRAPELQGRGWLNTGGESLRLGGLRGRFVLLDFWTFCCVNCLHVIDELRELEADYAGTLVVVGVHSPKFEHEADPVALAAAIERYDVRHAVLDDPDLLTWRSYTAQAWPTLVLVDPEGYLVAQYSGEGHVHGIRALLEDLIPRYQERGTFQPGGAPYAPAEQPDSVLRFPAKAIALPGNGFLVADAGHHSLAELSIDGETLVRRIGSGERGLVDGASEDARFSEPNGLCTLPVQVAEIVGYDVVVADTANHALRGVHLASGLVSTLAGDGRQWRPGDDTARLSSPWDVAWWRDRVWIAMAGIHQLWSLDPRSGEVRVEAGAMSEGLVDGPPADAWFAQPSGLAAAGERLWVADSESSALRWIDDRGVHTAVGEGLFDFGFRDGPREVARLQHPLGVAVLPDGTVAVADTYNAAVRRFDPSSGLLTTMATGLPEVSGLVVADQRLVAVVSVEHALVSVDPGASEAAPGSGTATPRPPMTIGPDVELRIGFVPPPGQKLDERFGPSTQLTVDATPEALLVSGTGVSTGLSRELRLDPAVGSGVLHISARAASCDADTGEGAACHLHQQDWGVPVTIDATGDGVLALSLAAVG